MRVWLLEEGVRPDMVTFPGIIVGRSCYTCPLLDHTAHVPTGETASSRVQVSVRRTNSKVIRSQTNLPLRISSTTGHTRCVPEGVKCSLLLWHPLKEVFSCSYSQRDDNPSFLLPCPDLSSPRYTPALTSCPQT